MKIVDLHDLACRESGVVRDFYHFDWFCRDESGIVGFNPPAFYLAGGVAEFVDGRHRAVLLSKYSNLIPMAITEMDAESQDMLNSCVEREMNEEEIFELKDLPIVEDVGLWEMGV